MGFIVMVQIKPRIAVSCRKVAGVQGNDVPHHYGVHADSAFCFDTGIHVTLRRTVVGDIFKKAVRSHRFRDVGDGAAKVGGESGRRSVETTVYPIKQPCLPVVYAGDIIPHQDSVLPYLRSVDAHFRRVVRTVAPVARPQIHRSRPFDIADFIVFEHGLSVCANALMTVIHLTGQSNALSLFEFINFVFGERVIQSVVQYSVVKVQHVKPGVTVGADQSHIA